MAYMTQENKKAIAPQIKQILKKYNMKGSISVQHHSTLVVTLKEGELDIIGNMMEGGALAYNERPEYFDVNTYWLDTNFTSNTLSFLNELKDAMNGMGSKGEQNFDKSDIQSDYHYVGWYITIKVGKWNHPYNCTEKEVF